MTCVVCLKLIFFVITLRFCTCINCLLAYFKVCGGAFDLAVEVTQIHLGSTFDPGTILYIHHLCGREGLA